MNVQYKTKLKQLVKDKYFYQRRDNIYYNGTLFTEFN